MAISYGRTDIETPIHAEYKKKRSVMVSLSVIWLILLARNQDYKEEVCYDLAVAGIVT